MTGQRSQQSSGKIHLAPDHPGFSQALVVPELVNGWIQLKPEVRAEIKKRLLAKFKDQKAAATHFGISQATMSERLNGRKGFTGTDLVDILVLVRIQFSPDLIQDIILKSHVEPRHNLILELAAVSVYQQEIGMPAIRNLFDIGHAYLHKTLHKCQQLGLLTVRSKSEGVKKAGEYAHYESTEVPEPYLTTFLQDHALTTHQAELLVATMLLTDGSLRQSTKKYSHSKKQYLEFHIEFFGKSKSLHDLFVDLIFHAFRIKPSTYVRNRGDDLLITSFIGKRADNATKTLLKISPSYRTKPHRDSVQQYLSNEPQPSLHQILKADIKTKILAFRIGMSCEGSVSLRTGSDEQIIRVDLKFACAHPTLTIQWTQLAREIGISFYLLKANEHTVVINDSLERIIEKVITFVREKKPARTWSGIAGLQTGKVDSALRFDMMGGFIPSVKVADYSSYKGCTKNQVLKALLWYRQDVESGTIPPTPESFTREFKIHEVLKRTENFGLC